MSDPDFRAAKSYSVEMFPSAQNSEDGLEKIVFKGVKDRRPIASSTIQLLSWIFFHM